MNYEEGDTSEMPDDIEELIEQFIEVQVNETVDEEMDDHKEQVFRELAEIRKENYQEIEKHFRIAKHDPHTMRNEDEEYYRQNYYMYRNYGKPRVFKTPKYS